ncbi:hypothetical protein C882_3368 [Caenispirillum salinarum AK4]|uniref:Uncharacterized protein n=1 Tax=Caenispirillum salinarum AK4 TaxID=1238182 RepID=K9H5N3_9PROT|nr:hypothetical protein C882_3368 [Caenispirillum salinarum AK4]
MTGRAGRRCPSCHARPALSARGGVVFVFGSLGPPPRGRPGRALLPPPGRPAGVQAVWSGTGPLRRKKAGEARRVGKSAFR